MHFFDHVKNLALFYALHPLVTFLSSISINNTTTGSQMGHINTNLLNLCRVQNQTAYLNLDMHLKNEGHNYQRQVV